MTLNNAFKRFGVLILCGYIIVTVLFILGIILTSIGKNYRSEYFYYDYGAIILASYGDPSTGRTDDKGEVYSIDCPGDNPKFIIENYSNFPLTMTVTNLESVSDSCTANSEDNCSFYFYSSSGYESYSVEVVGTSFYPYEYAFYTAQCEIIKKYKLFPTILVVGAVYFWTSIFLCCCCLASTYTYCFFYFAKYRQEHGPKYSAGGLTSDYTKLIDEQAAPSRIGLTGNKNMTPHWDTQAKAPPRYIEVPTKEFVRNMPGEVMKGSVLARDEEVQAYRI